MADAYVSFARADRERVEAIVRALEARGFDIWWKPELAADAPAARAALQEAKAVLVAWSDAAARSGEVRSELDAAQATLLAFLVEAVELPAPGGAAEDLSRWPDAAAAPAFERLVQALATRRGRPATAVTTRASRAAQLQPLVLLGGAVAILAIAIFFALQVVRDPDALTPAPGAPGFADAQGQTTDSPGAAERYGLARQEIESLPPLELIQLALQRTTIEAIEAEAARGDRLGQTLLCLSRAFGEGLDRNADAARRACEQASASGDALASYMLSTFVRAGAAGYAPNPGDAAEADRLLQASADAGDARALMALGRERMLAGQGDEALEFARSAAEKGYLPAQVFVGWMFEEGRGVAQDYSQAMLWYSRAGRSGSPAGMRSLGGLYERGLGVPRDYARAREQYASASNLGDGEASWRLARMCERGLGGARDLARARALYMTAVAQGYAPAQADALRVRG